MYYVTGDVHGGQEMWHEKITPFLKPGDTILVAGDFGVGFFIWMKNSGGSSTSFWERSGNWIPENW